MVRRMDLVKKNDLAVTQQRLCMRLERGMGRAGFPDQGGRERRDIPLVMW